MLLLLCSILAVAEGTEEATAEPKPTEHKLTGPELDQKAPKVADVTNNAGLVTPAMRNTRQRSAGRTADSASTTDEQSLMQSLQQCLMRTMMFIETEQYDSTFNPTPEAAVSSGSDLILRTSLHTFFIVGSLM